MPANNDSQNPNYPAAPGTLTVAGGAGFNPSAPFNVAPTEGQTVLTVGPNGMFQTIAAAVAVANTQSGDLILVTPGTYTNDFADITAPMTIAGAGGMVDLVATEALPNEKGIFIVDNSVQIDNLTFSGAEIADSVGGNGAGIRYQGGNLVLNNDAFFNNQNGLMGGGVDNLPQNTITITDSTFSNNGQTSGPNAGYTHNIYVGYGTQAFTATHDVFERANVGHEVKSRAVTNLISNNIIYDGPTGTASYSIDLPNGGADTVSNNTIEKGPHAENYSIIHYGGEGIPYAGSALTLTGNHIINDLGPQAIGVLNQTTLQVQITGNELDHFEGATIALGPYTQSGNWDENGNTIAGGNSNGGGNNNNLLDFSGDNLPHTVTFTTVGGVRGGGGLLTVYADTGHITALGGIGGLNYQELPNMGGAYVTTQAGATDTVVALGQDTVQSMGTDTITAGAGNLTAEIDGIATVTGGSGNDGYNVNGTLSLTGSGGGDTVQLNNTGSVATVTGSETYFQSSLNAGTLAYDIQQGGAEEAATISGGGVAVRVYGATTNITTAGGTAGANIAFGAGVVSMRSEGADTIQAGSGPATILVSGSSQITAGTGALAIYGHSETGVATVNGAAGSVTIDGDTGGIVFSGGAQANSLNAVLSSITVNGGAGMLNIAGGSRQIVNGGSGGIIFATSGGADTITTAAGATDTLQFTGACTVTSNGTDHITDGNANSFITANGAATITGSTGAAQYALNGQDSLNANGNTRATVGAGAHDTVTSYGAYTSVTDNGGTLVFSQLANADGETATVTGVGTTLQAAAGTPVTNIGLNAHGNNAVLGGGHEEVTVSAAGTRIWANHGTDTINVNAGGGTIWGGGAALTLNMTDYHDQAAVTLHGGFGAITQAAGYGALVFTGGHGNAMLGGVSGGETVTAGSGNISLVGGSAGTRFTAGSGNANVTLTRAGGTVIFGNGSCVVQEAAGGSQTTYDFNSGTGGGYDTITGFQMGTDHIVLGGVSINSDSVVSGNTLLTLTDGTHVTLAGVTNFHM